MTPSRIRAATIAVFVVAALLRLGLATVNREQSDNHVTLINLIASEGRIPDYDRAHEEPKEGFQPKLYHGTVAAILTLDPSGGAWRPCAAEYPGSPHVVWIGQTVSATAGILTLAVLLRFLGLLGLSDRARFFTFALIALNPALVGINVQVTNDSFVILFGSLALYWGYRFFRDVRPWDFVWMTASAVATAMSKATGLPVVLAIATVFAITIVWPPAPGAPARARTLGYATAFLVAFLATLTILAPRLGSYWELYRRYGSPFVTNRMPEPFPRLFERTIFTGDPGVRSIAESLFTFRIAGLVREPVVFNDRDRFPLHRTSLWSQIYGRLNFTRFDGYFETWRPHSALAPAAGRLAFLLALFPAALFVGGASRGVARVVARAADVPPHEWLIAVAAAGDTAFLIALALRYRDFSFFKPIHVFAGLLAFAAVFGRACARVFRDADDRPAPRPADVLLGSLVVLYALDCTALALHLLESCRSA